MTRGKTLKRVTWMRWMLAVAAFMAGLDMVALGLKSRAFDQSMTAVETSIALEQQLQNLRQQRFDLGNHSSFDATLDTLDRDLRTAFSTNARKTSERSFGEAATTVKVSDIVRLWSSLYVELQDLSTSNSPSIEPLQDEFTALITAIKTQRTQHLQALAANRSIVDSTAISLAALSLVASVLAYAFLSQWLAELQQVVTASHRRIDSVGDSIMQQRRIVSDQATSVAEITQMLDKLNGTSQTSSEQASIAASRAKEITELTSTGVQLVIQTQAAILGIETQTNAIAKQISQLRIRAMEVGQIALLVEELAMRTNTLSLNAAIEAVRANRSGAGFQVIAKEIRELSVQSQQAARRIGAMSDDIERAVETTVQVSQEGLEQAEAGARIVNDTTTTFNQIKTAIEEVNNTSHRMAFNAYELLWPLQQVMEAMESLNNNARSTETNSNHLAEGLSDLEHSFERIQDGIRDRRSSRSTPE